MSDVSWMCDNVTLQGPCLPSLPGPLTLNHKPGLPGFSHNNTKADMKGFKGEGGRREGRTGEC